MLVLLIECFPFSSTTSQSSTCSGIFFFSAYWTYCICVIFLVVLFYIPHVQSNILALCEANLDDSVDSGNFSVRGYFPLIQKDSITHMHGLAVYVKEGLPFAQDLSVQILTYVLDWLYFTQCLTSFLSVNHLLCRYARFLILFHLTFILGSLTVTLTVLLLFWIYLFLQMLVFVL